MKYLRKSPHCWKKKAAVVCILVILFSFTTGTIAWLTLKTQPLNNEFLLGSVAGSIVENYADHVKTSIAVQNDGNIPAFARIKLTAYWQKNDDTILGKTAVVPSFSISSGWFLKDGIYYCRNVIAPSGLTPNLLASEIPLTVDADGNRLVIDVFAELIQAQPDAAAADAWGVSVSNGVIQ